MLQDVPSKPKYLVTFTVGYEQKANINAAVKKVKQNNLKKYRTEKIYSWPSHHALAIIITFDF